MVVWRVREGRAVGVAASSSLIDGCFLNQVLSLGEMRKAGRICDRECPMQLAWLGRLVGLQKRLILLT